MRKWIVRLVILTVLVGGWVGLQRTVLAAKPVVVEVAEVGRGRVEAVIANTKAGTIRARRRAKLSPGTSGIVLELLVERGERVKRGQVLLRLDDATPLAQVVLSERALDVTLASHARSCLTADRALRELKRNQDLRETDIVSEDHIDRLQSMHDVAVADCTVGSAEVERARAAVAAARVELAKTELRAPFDAIVAEVSTELGEWVTPSVPLMSAPHLIDAIDPSSLYVSAPIDEVEAGRLAVGQTVRVTIDSHPGKSFPGRTVRVAPFVLDIEQQNRTVEVEVELEDEKLSASLLPGTSADVEIILESKENALRVPTYALLEGNHAFVLTEGGVLEKRHVEVGLRSWTFVEVLSGVKQGELIVTSFDADQIEDGQVVVVAGESTDGGGK